MPSVEPACRSAGPSDFDRDGLLLVDTMELVEPRQHVRRRVPDHLLETKHYSKLARNNVIEAQPSSIHFAGFKVGKTQSELLYITNVSLKIISVHIIPPQSKYFKIRDTKMKQMAPGLQLACKVDFYPDEWRYYYDCIRINCLDEENLVVPIHSYPVMNTDGFPEHFSFSPVPVGKTVRQVFTLQCQVPVDFEFQLHSLYPDPAFSVEPMEGIVPANGKVEISVTFSPVEYRTSQITLELMVSQFNSKPKICTIGGTSVPGQDKEQDIKLWDSKKEKELQLPAGILDPFCVSPLHRSRIRRKAETVVRQTSGIHKEEIECQGIYFPANLNNPHAVGKVLTQKAGRMKVKDMKAALEKTMQSDSPVSRQMKEASFDTLIRKNSQQERQNQLQWQSKLGDGPMMDSQKAKVLDQQQHAWLDYKYQKRGDPVPDVEYRRSHTISLFRRTHRSSFQMSEASAKFNLYANDMWALRHRALKRFIQAARKVIFQKRISHRLCLLRQGLDDWLKQNANKDSAEILEKEEESGDNLTRLTEEKIQAYQFVTGKSSKTDEIDNSLGKLEVKPNTLILKKQVAYFDLKIPQNFMLMGYEANDVHESSSGYVPFRMTRLLRTGAEEEIICLPITDEDAGTEERKLQQPEKFLTWPKEPAGLANSPPMAMFQPTNYPPLHIFNPVPQLQLFEKILPYSAVDADFNVCPVPRFPQNNSVSSRYTKRQRKYLDREDIIKGVMAWKKFPSQGLSVLAILPSLNNVWVPRWDDYFDEGLLPTDHPPFLQQLPEDLKDNILTEGDSLIPEQELSSTHIASSEEILQGQLQPDIHTSSGLDREVFDMFPHGEKLPASYLPVGDSGYISKDERERQLEYFITSKYNQLGREVEVKIMGMNNLITDSDRKSEV